MPSLNLEEAERILAAAKAKVQEMGVKLSVSVVDPRGDLIAMFRTDGASWRTPLISRGKAVAASCFGMSSKDLEERFSMPFMQGFMAMQGGHMIPGQGALPVFRNGELIGAAGGSGGERTAGRGRGKGGHRGRWFQYRGLNLVSTFHVFLIHVPKHWQESRFVAPCAR